MLVCTFSLAQDTEDQDTCVVFSLTEIEPTVGDSVCTSIIVSNFENLLSFQFSLRYDDSVLSYGECAMNDAIRSFGCSEINLQDDAPVFKILWFDPLGDLVTLEDETTLASLCFLVTAEPASGQKLLQFTDDLAAEATKGDPSDLSVAEKFPFCSQADITSNVIDISQNDQLSIFPNPAVDVLFIENKDGSVLVDQISIYSISGQLAMRANQSKVLSEIKVSQLEQGHYFIRIDLNDGSGYSGSFYKE